MRILTPEEVTHFESLTPDEFVQLTFDLKEVIAKHSQVNTIISKVKQFTGMIINSICDHKRPS